MSLKKRILNILNNFICSPRLVRKAYVEGYRECEKVNSDKKYTAIDLENAFNSGKGYGVPDDIKDFNSFINSLNKQE